jgi:excisionase family DNA binding protein
MSDPRQAGNSDEVPMGALLQQRLAGSPLARASVEPTEVAPLLDARGAATLLNVPASWVLAEARANRIPHVRLGRYVRFDAGELQAWWLSRRRGPWRSRGRAAKAAHAAVSPSERVAYYGPIAAAKPRWNAGFRLSASRG